MDNQIINEDLDFFAKYFPFLQEVSNSTILITGATGLIGSMLIKCLLKLNHIYDTNISIVAIARNSQRISASLKDEYIRWIYQDLQKLDLMELKNIEADFIFHCASPTASEYFTEHPVETINTILKGTQQILQYTLSSNSVKGMLYVSSIESYGRMESKETFVTEVDFGAIDSIDARSSYSLGKKMAECLCYSYAKEYDVPVTIARLTQTFGAGVSLYDSRVFAQFAKCIMNDEDIVLHTKGESSKPYCYTIDAILAFFYIVLKGRKGEAYNVANSGSYLSIYELAQFLSDNFNPKCKIRIEEKENTSYAPSTKVRLSTEKLERLGWKPYFQLKDMFSRLITFYQNELENIVE